MRTGQSHEHSHGGGTRARAAEPRRARRPRHSWSVAGQVVMGPSFYIWDESPKQARDWGVELANAWLAHDH